MSTDALCNKQAASQLSLILAISILLLLLLNLIACIVGGASYRETLSQIIQVHVLKSFELRAHDWYFWRGCSSLDESHWWIWHHLLYSVLDFRFLGSLEIGRLPHHEARGLAEEIARLQLIDLKSPPVRG